MLRNIVGVSFAALLVVYAAPPTATLAHPDVIPDLVGRVIGGVVNIATVSPKKDDGKAEKAPATPNVPKGSPFEDFFKEFSDKQQNKGAGKDSKMTSSLASGFIIDERGTIVTADFVVEGATEITVSLADGTKLPATVIGTDKKTNIALLKIAAGKPLTALRFGDSSKLRVGQTVVAIGNPFGLGGSVSSGIVSGLNRDINAGPYDRFIQTDAAINKGNSGGPLFNLDGEVIGINTAILTPTGASAGIAFAVPANLATEVIAQLDKFGETRRGWLGVSIQAVTEEIAASHGMKKAMGALVVAAAPNGPAGNGGIMAGDVILSFGGHDIAAMRDLPRIVAGTEIGKTVDVKVLRKGEERTLKITIAQLPEKSGAPPPPSSRPGGGLTPDQLRKLD